MSTAPLTVVMLSLNEEVHLPGVIENIRGWAEEIFLVDSCSTDRTIDIALEEGIGVVQRPFTNFGDQWNFALDHLPINTPWTLKLDPDERLTPELRDEISRLLDGTPSCAGYSMRRRLWFMGRPLHVKVPVLRLWRTGSCRFSDVIVNEHPLIDGPEGKLKGILEHLDSPNLDHWFAKQNRYSTMEAIMMVSGAGLAAQPKLFGSPLERRMFLKKIFFRLPLRYVLQWIHELFIRGAWRDGRSGFTWARLRVQVRRFRELKAREMRRTGHVPRIPESPAGSFDPRVLESSLQKAVVPSMPHDGGAAI